MYLSDKDIEKVIDEINVSTSDPKRVFDIQKQLQPCSIDLRLDIVFWRQRRKCTVDFRHAKAMELDPTRHWQKIFVPAGQSLKLRPGEFVLGRTYEQFTIPAGHAGKLEGRSSFARLGIGIHFSADFINPGYRGQMPIQISNYGKNAIVLVPYLAICQLILIKLSTKSKRLYSAEIGSKYLDDDGGPSLWWRDKQIQRIHDQLGNQAVHDEIQNEILALIGEQDPRLLQRFEKYVYRLPSGEITNANDLLDMFATKEDHTRKRKFILRRIPLWLGPSLLIISIASLLRQPIGLEHVVFWLFTLLVLVFSGWTYIRTDEPGDFLGSEELRKLRQQSRLRSLGADKSKPRN